MSEIKQVKYLDHLVTDIGTRNEPFLLYVTRGQRDDSFISHFKEDGLYFQYSAFSIRKSGLILKCIYCVRKKCPAKLEVIAMKKDLIVREEKNIRKFYLSKNLNLNEFSQKDWMFKNGSSIGEHVFFCTNQVDLAKRPRMEDIVEIRSTPAQIKAHKQQWCRFDKGQPLARAFRFEHTRSAVIQQTCQIKHVENAWEMTDLGGARLLELISDTKNEKRSRNYYINKNSVTAEEVNPKFLHISDTCPLTLTAIKMDFIHLDQKSTNMTPIYLESELHFFNYIDIFVDGTFSVCDLL